MGSFVVLPGAGAQIAAALHQVGADLSAAAEPKAQINMAFDQMLITQPQQADILAATFRPEEGQEYSQIISDIVGEDRAKALAARPPSLEEKLRDAATEQWEAFSVEEKANFLKENQFPGTSPLEVLKAKIGVDAFQLLSGLSDGTIKESELTGGQKILLESMFKGLFTSGGTTAASDATLYANARPVFLRLQERGFNDFSMPDVVQYTLNPESRPDIKDALDQVFIAEQEEKDLKISKQDIARRSVITGRINTIQNNIPRIQSQLDAERMDEPSAEVALQNVALALNEQFGLLSDAGGESFEAEFVPRVKWSLKTMFTGAKRAAPGVKVTNKATGTTVTVEEFLRTSSAEPTEPGVAQVPAGTEEPSRVVPPADFSVLSDDEKRAVADLMGLHPTEELPAVLTALKELNRPLYDNLVAKGVIQ